MPHYIDHDMISAEYSVIEQAYNIHLLRYTDSRQKLLVAKNVEYQEVPRGSAFPVAPTAKLLPELAQQLFDDLWRAGLRPSTKDESPAKDEHLRDLRMILFHQLGMTS